MKISARFVKNFKGGSEILKCCLGARTKFSRGQDNYCPRTIGRAATAHGRRPCWGWVREGVAPSRNGGPGVLPPEFFFDHTSL